MLLWGTTTIGLLFFGLVARWYIFRRPDWRIMLLSIRLNRLIRRNQRSKIAVHRLLKQIYSLINFTIQTNNAVAAYQAVDLLKIALGERLARHDEPMRMMALAVAALRTKQPDVAGYVLDAFKPMLRTLEDEQIPVAMEQVTLIAVVSMKLKQSFIIAKVADLIFTVIEQNGRSNNTQILTAGLRSLRIIGLMALRRRDDALFREMNIRFLSVASGYRDGDISGEIIIVLSAWLHHIVKNNAIVMFDTLSQLSFQFAENILDNSSIEALISEWENLAGTACLNPQSELAPRIVEFILNLAETSYHNGLWRKTINAAGQIAKLAIDKHGLQTAFPILYPLLDTGRRLLLAELRSTTYCNELRQKNLFLILRECIMLATIVARRDMTSTTGEIIAQLYLCWANYPDMRGNPKSVKKFCQLLLLYWLKTRQRQARRGLPDHCELVKPMLISDAEKERFGLS